MSSALMLAALRYVPLLALVSACALGWDEPTDETSSVSDSANINLIHASARATLTSDAEWSLTKIGSIAGNTVTWNITATKTATVRGQLVVQGEMTVSNSGLGTATIGNIVVNLQTESRGTWRSVSADVADAIHGDAATSARIHAQASTERTSLFKENGASGSLELTDATHNTIFALVPEARIPGGATRSLLFQAMFNNDVLHLATNTAIRAEVIVSFGNATTDRNSAANVDINGSGQIDYDEFRIRSVPALVRLRVPPQQDGNQNPTLSDTASDITSTGTVTFSNVQINLGATSGTVTATVDAGADGGRITNCAHLTAPGMTVNSGSFVFTRVPSLELQACDTQDIGGQSCASGAPGCGWSTGSLTTYNQFETGWGHASTPAGRLLRDYFGAVYGGFGAIIIGDTHTIELDSAPDVFEYLPQGGAAGVQTSSLVNPTDSSAGELGGDVLALELNVRFSADRLLPHTSSTTLGALRICGYDSRVDGQTVNQFLATANLVLSNGFTDGVDPAFAREVAAQIDAAFLGGAPSSFAQSYLVVGMCP